MKSRIMNFGFRMVRRGLIAVALLAACWFGLFRTGVGRAALERGIALGSGDRVRVSGLDGRLPRQGRVGEVRVSDGAGVWLVVSNASWELRLADLVRPPFRIRKVQAEGAEVLRWPKAGPASARKSGRPALQVDHFSVGPVQLTPLEISGSPLRIRAEGEMVMGPQGFFALLEGEEQTTHRILHGVVRLAAPDRPTVFAVQAREAHRSASAYGSRETNGWRGSLEVADEKVGKARMGWTYRSDGTWEVDAQTEAVEGKLAGLTWAVTSARLHAQPKDRLAQVWVAGQFGGESVWAEGPLVRRPEGWRLPQLSVWSDGLRVRMTVAQGAPWYGSGRMVSAPGSAIQRWTSGKVDAESRVNFAWSGTSFRVSATIPQLHTPAGDMAGLKAEVQRAAGQTEISVPLLMAQEWRKNGRVWLDSLRTRGSLQPLQPGWRIAVENAVVERDTLEFAMQEPMTVEVGPTAIAWSTTRVAVAGGEILTHGHLADTLEADLAWRDLPLARLFPGRLASLEGRIEGSLTGRGSAADPDLEGALYVRHLRPRQLASGVAFQPAELTVTAQVRAGRLSAEALFSGWSDDPVRAAIGGPVHLSLRPWHLAVARDEDWQGSVRGTYDLARLPRVFDLRGTRVSGQVDGSLQLSGPLDQPQVEGHLGLVGGALEIPASGTTLREINILLTGDRRQLVIQSASASDGGTGRLSMAGSVLLDPVRHFPVDLRLTLERAQLWQRGGSRLRADGALDARGDLQNLTLSGLVLLPEAVVLLERRRPAIPRLPLAGVADPNRAVAVVQPPPAWPERIKLDVGVQARRGARVSGRGLESEWRADLQARGTLAAPRITGSAQATQGYFLFMGRRFDLETTWVGLDGGWPIRPTVNLIATSRAGDLAARLHVSGTLLQPSLELTSDPAYPPDEIVSRLLFGKSADSISAFQAVSLAHGLNVLRGKSSALDVLDRSQSLLRVDQLELRQDDEQGTLSSVSVGKYIGRRVFLQGEAALDGSGEVIAVEVDLRPSLTLQTEASPGIREGIGLKWRRDY